MPESRREYFHLDPKTGKVVTKPDALEVHPGADRALVRAYFKFRPGAA